MSQEVALKVREHDIEIGILKNMMVDNSVVLKESVTATNKLTVQLGVYIANNEHTKEQVQVVKKSIEDLGVKVYANTLAVADMHPTVIALRGLMWKVTGVVLLGGGGVAAIIVAVENALKG